MGRNKAPSNPSQKKLVKYFTHAARDAGKAGEEAAVQNKCYRGGQAGYSLLWYFEHCIKNDLDSRFDNFSPLLSAYLGGDISGIVELPAISEKQIAEERHQLKELFPQSKYPLNQRQIEAVHKALHYPLSIIKGPPGTGKTETILRIAALALSQGQTVAIVSTNKAAVENVEVKLNEARKYYLLPSLDSVRLHAGEDLAFSAACKHVCLGAKDRRAKAEDPVTNACLAFDADSNKGVHRFLDGETTSGWEQNKLHHEFTTDYPLITSTIHSLKKCFADGEVKKYDLLIMDEASQTNLIVGIVAMSCARRMVLVGDEEQLPPVVTESHQSVMKKYSDKKGLFKQDKESPYDISRDGLSFLTSCYQVFSDRNPSLMTMLNEHFRCHSAIIGFCNKEVYGGELVVKSQPKNADIACPIRVCWYEGDYREGVWPPKAPPEENPNQKQRSTYVNRKQLLILEQEEAPHLRELAEKNKSICILSPFRGQIFALMNSVKRILSDVVKEDAIAIEASTDQENDAQVANDRIHALTIHKSQGREFDAVYLLPVEDGNWEWPWSQGRRLVNVAASRAKEELIVILSTKLMEKDTQRGLAGRDANVKNPAKAADDKNNQEMYVRRLVEHTRKLVSLNTEEERRDPFYGFHRSVITSLFDNIPFKQAKRKDKDYAPELCVKEALTGSSLAGLAFAQDVKFDQLRLSDGFLLNKACEDRYQRSEQAHFDFIIYEPESKRLIMAIEVDGAQHRFKRKDGSPDHTQHEMDTTKDAVAKEVCGAELCWLGAIRSGSLLPEKHGNESFGKAESLENGIRSPWPSWKPFPSKIDPEASFIFLRIPSDGSTFWETELLKEQAKRLGADKNITNKKLPPTIEEYLEKQLSLNSKNLNKKYLVYLGEGAEEARINTKPPQDKEQNSPQAANKEEQLAWTITKCLEEWHCDPALAIMLDGVKASDMNKHLLGAGYQMLEEDNSRRRKPTDLGKSIGIEELKGSGPEGEYTYPGYSLKARAYIAEHMREILQLGDVLHEDG